MWLIWLRLENDASNRCTSLRPASSCAAEACNAFCHGKMKEDFRHLGATEAKEYRLLVNRHVEEEGGGSSTLSG